MEGEGFGRETGGLKGCRGGGGVWDGVVGWG